jgi:nicotinamide-nucleotide amidase
MDFTTLEPRVAALGDALRARGWRIATAESCTGGLLAAACTSIGGSSDWFERGFVTYSNEAKTDLLGVPAALIAQHGAVSEAVVRAMAEGALRHAPAQMAVAITGVAGPSGGTPAKPVGTVWFALAVAGASPRLEVQRLQLTGDRSAVRRLTVEHAIDRLLATTCSSP